jgi:uncharacterized membrane protein YvlD (DUF360 family)
MFNFLIRLVVLGLAFHFVLPLIKGIEFHGNFTDALIAGAFFAIIGWAFEALAVTLSAIFAITTFGLGLLILIPAWVIGFWLMPAVVLKVVADMLPSYLTINGWLPAVWGGLVMLFIGVLTSKKLFRGK